MENRTSRYLFSEYLHSLNLMLFQELKKLKATIRANSFVLQFIAFQFQQIEIPKIDMCLHQCLIVCLYNILAS